MIHPSFPLITTSVKMVVIVSKLCKMKPEEGKQWTPVCFSPAGQYLKWKEMSDITAGEKSLNSNLLNGARNHGNSCRNMYKNPTDQLESQEQQLYGENAAKTVRKSVKNHSKCFSIVQNETKGRKRWTPVCFSPASHNLKMEMSDMDRWAGVKSLFLLSAGSPPPIPTFRAWRGQRWRARGRRWRTPWWRTSFPTKPSPPDGGSPCPKRRRRLVLRRKQTDILRERR